MNSKRYLVSFARVALSVVLAFIVLAIATRMFAIPSSPPVRAALHESPATPYHNVIVVAKSGGDYTSIQKALDGITNNSPSNRYLVWVAPGTYDERVTMKPYVDIEGAGELVTRIVNTRAINSGTVLGASNAELRYLTVESNRSSVYTAAIVNTNASPRLLHVTAINAQGTSYDRLDTGGSSPTIWQSYGIRNTNGSSPIMADVTVSNTVATSALGYGVANESNSSPTMRNVTISISGGAVANEGVYNDNSSATMTDVTISALGGTGNAGVYNNNSSSTMKNVTITASSQGVQNSGSGNFRVTIDDSTISAPYRTISNYQSYATRVGVSKLEGGPVEGNVTYAGVYDENYIFFPNTCP